MILRHRVLGSLVAAVSVWPLDALAQQAPPATPVLPPWQWGGPRMMWGDGYGWPFFWGGPIMMIALIFGFVWLTRLLFGHARWRDELRHGGAHGDLMERMGHSANASALRILNERFARGEIQKDEYEEKKATLLATTRPI